MSESDKTFDLLGKHHAALANLIAKNAWQLAGAMVTGLVIEIDGKLIPVEHQILKELQDEINKEIRP